MEKGVKIEALLNSNIYNYEFECDEWPEVHFNRDHVLRPYNKTIFELRNNYATIFPEPEL